MNDHTDDEPAVEPTPEHSEALDTAVAQVNSGKEKADEGLAEMGAGLKAIRDQELWFGYAESFDAFCQNVWNFSRQYADSVIRAHRVHSTLKPTGLPLPTTYSGTLALASLLDEPDVLVEVWNEVLTEQANDPTAERIRRAVRARRPSRQGQARGVADTGLYDLLASVVAHIGEHPGDVDDPNVQRLLAILAAVLRAVRKHKGEAGVLDALRQGGDQ